MEITKREVLASVSIIAIMLLIGFLISGKISNSVMDDNEKLKMKICSSTEWKRTLEMLLYTVS